MGGRCKRDPMNGYLANLDGDDYKQHFRPRLPEWMAGKAFIEKFGGTIDTATTVDATIDYPVQHAADHHVLEARRVKHFAQFIEEAACAPSKTRDQGRALDKAGHLMYASHLSYTNDAMLGADECDLLVSLVKKHEPAGLYAQDHRRRQRGNGGGAGGCERKGGWGDIEYHGRVRAADRAPSGFVSGLEPGAWSLPTAVVS